MSAAAPDPDGVPWQATCVAIAGRGVLIEGAPGSGKSSLALALIDRGAVLVGDDGVWLVPRAGRLWALPPPAIRGLLEIRNVGLVTLPAAEAPVALLLHLAADAPRLPAGPYPESRAGMPLPALTLAAAAPALHLRAEHALRLFGIA